MPLFDVFYTAPMVCGKKFMSQLHSLVNLPKDSPFLYTATRDLLLLAFKEPKPLLSQEERNKAAELLKKSLPLLESAFTTLHGSLNPDLRQVAQQCRSGLQFLVDEFEQNQIYQEIQPILTSSPVKCVEEYIENTKGIVPEYSTQAHQDLRRIPTTHYWWIEEDTD